MVGSGHNVVRSLGFGDAHVPLSYERCAKTGRIYVDKIMAPKDVDGMTDSVDPGQTASLGEV